MATKLHLILAASLMTACGSAPRSNNQAATPTSTDPAASPAAATPDVVALFLGDQSAASQALTSQVDAAVGAAAEENEASQSGLSLLGADKAVQMQRSRVCTVNGSDAVVEITASLTVDRILDLPHRSFETKFAAYNDRVRTWSMAGGTVACAADGKHAQIDVTKIAGVSLATTVKEIRSRDNSATNKKTGKVVAQGFKFERDGTRNLSWKAVNLVGTAYQIDKEATHQFQETTQVAKADGTTVSLSSSQKTLDGAPLEITVQRDQTTHEILGRTIHSGSLEGTHTDGTRVDTVLKEVVYDATSGDKCMPVSGEIDGSIFKSGETTASLTYTITFADQNGTIAFSNGKTSEFSPEGCDLDDPTDKAVDAAKSAVTPPANVGPAPAASTATATGAAAGH